MKTIQLLTPIEELDLYSDTETYERKRRPMLRFMDDFRLHIKAAATFGRYKAAVTKASKKIGKRNTTHHKPISLQARSSFKEQSMLNNSNWSFRINIESESPSNKKIEQGGAIFRSNKHTNGMEVEMAESSASIRSFDEIQNSIRKLTLHNF